MELLDITATRVSLIVSKIWNFVVMIWFNQRYASQLSKKIKNYYLILLTTKMITVLRVVTLNSCSSKMSFGVKEHHIFWENFKANQGKLQSNLILNYYLKC